MKQFSCVLMLEGDPRPNLDYPLIAIEQPDGKVDYYEARIRTKPGNRYYVNFYGPENYKCWANWVMPGMPFIAKQTGKYRYTVGGASRAQQVRMDKAHRSEGRMNNRRGKAAF